MNIRVGPFDRRVLSRQRHAAGCYLGLEKRLPSQRWAGCPPQGQQPEQQQPGKSLGCVERRKPQQQRQAKKAKEEEKYS